MTKKDFLQKVYEQLFQAYGAQQWWPAKTPFEVMVGAILTQSTSWQNVEKAVACLESKNLLNPHNMFGLKEAQLAKLIRPSGYFNQKAKKLKCFLHYFVGRYRGNVVSMKKQKTNMLRRELLDIYGIGPETADSMLLYALQKSMFVIDTYTKRIFSRLGLLKGDEQYHEVQKLFMKHLTKNTRFYNEYHALIVCHGKQVCKKSRPLCGECPLHQMCHYYHARRPVP